MAQEEGALQAQVDALETEFANALGIKDVDAKCAAFRRLERLALDIAHEAIRQSEIAVLAPALRLSALGGLFHNNWNPPRSNMCRRLRAARRILLQQLVGSRSTKPARDLFQLAKIEAVRASILEQSYRQRSVRGMHAASRLFGRAQDLFRAVGEEDQAIHQCANKAQAMFTAGTLGDLSAYEVAAQAFGSAARALAPEISAEQRAVWLGFQGSALGALAEQGWNEHAEIAAKLMRDALSRLEGTPNARAFVMISLNLAGLSMHSRGLSWQRDIDESIARLESIRPLVEQDDELAPAIDFTLCAAYIFAPGGTLTGNIERAIKAGERSLALLNQAASPADTAKASENLAMAYALRIRGDQAANFSRAMELIECALCLTPRTQYSTAWSDRQGNAGRILLLHGVSEPRRYARAFQRLRSAFKARPQGERSSGPAGILHLNAAIALLAANERRRSTCRVAAAAHAARQAIGAFSHSADAESRRRASTVLADCAAATGDWNGALALLEQARCMLVSGDESFRSEPETFATATRALGSYADMHSAAAYCAVMVGQPRRALDLLEDAKAVALRRVLDRRRQNNPEPAKRIAPDASVIALAPVFHREGSAVLIALSTANRTEIVDVVHLAGVTRNTLTDFLHLGSQDAPPFSRALYDDDATSVSKVVEVATAWLWENVVGPVVETLERQLPEGPHRLVLCPQAGSGALPWHAAAPSYFSLGPLWSRGRLTYVPSLSLLWKTPTWTSERTKIVTVADPTGGLEGPEGECTLIARLAGGKCQHFGAQNPPTIDAIASACADASVIHFSAHGDYDAFTPQSSKLYFDNERGLSIGEIAAHLRLENGPLVTLAACESGVADFTERSDEFLGMPSAFLAAGASCVIASQWKVSDQISALFFIDFYRRIYRDGLLPADAIVATANMVRTLSPEAALRGGEGWSVSEETVDDAVTISRNPDHPFAHPFYWAPFVLTGRGW